MFHFSKEEAVSQMARVFRKQCCQFLYCYLGEYDFIVKQLTVETIIEMSFQHRRDNCKVDSEKLETMPKFVFTKMTMESLNGIMKVNKSVYIAKSKQLCHKTLDNILLHVPNHALKDMFMLHYGTKKLRTVSEAAARGVKHLCLSLFLLKLQA